MKPFLSLWLASFTKSLKSGNSLPRQRQVRLGVECLEGRELLSAAPLAPWFTATGVSATQIKLAWNAVSGATGYTVDYRVNGGAWAQLNATIGAGQTSLVLNCSRGALYTFDMIAYNSAGYSPWANAQNAITQYNPAAAAAYSPAPAGASLFGPTGTPSPTAVTQGYEGDCWLLASLAATAAQKPQDIIHMFTYEGTAVENGATVGLYKVRFFNKSNAPVYITVDTELPGGGNTLQTGGYYDEVTNPMGTQALWVALAEKAYAEAVGLGYVTASYSGDSYNTLDGGYPQWALHAITGSSAAYSFVPSNLAACWAAGDIIVLTSDGGPSTNNVDPNNPYIVGGHAYAVVGYNGSSFELLNPWGTAANGTAPEKGYNGDYVWGEAWFSAAFLSQNFNATALSSTASVHNAATNPSNGTLPSRLDGSLPGGPASLHHLGGSQETHDVWATPSSEWDGHMPAELDNLLRAG